MNLVASKHITFCLAEDRPDNEIGLRLAVLSLHRYMPDASVHVYRPDPESAFGQWVRRFPQVTFVPSAPTGASSWNCKPHALEPLLAQGYKQVVWLDSDIIVTKDIRQLFEELDAPILSISQEPASLPNQGTAKRSSGWNLKVGRSIPFTLNSAVLRVTQHHLPLLERWKAMMADERYIASQTRPLEERPLHMMSDQDVLNGLLGCTEFSDIPLHIVRSGRDIIHAGGALGYSTGERVRGIFNPKPAFLHATAGKPWLWLGGQPYWSQRTFFSWHRRLLQELSPYLHEARHYRDELDRDWAWMYKRTQIGTLLRLIGFGHFALRGLPLTMIASILDIAGKVARQTPPSSAPASGKRELDSV